LLALRREKMSKFNHDDYASIMSDVFGKVLGVNKPEPYDIEVSTVEETKHWPNDDYYIKNFGDIDPKVVISSMEDFLKGLLKEHEKVALMKYLVQTNVIWQMGPEWVSHVKPYIENGTIVDMRI
jgi:hypothetical protein